MWLFFFAIPEAGHLIKVNLCVSVTPCVVRIVILLSATVTEGPERVKVTILASDCVHFNDITLYCSFPKPRLLSTLKLTQERYESFSRIMWDASLFI
jgi:hypothetical protein